jgi:Tfp pilus assembly protein PilX
MSIEPQHLQIPRLRERGMVSITVTMILMIVLSLIVLGFAQIARRNQRQALDQQLSTQAFYAAESGINDVRNLVKSAGAGATVPAKTSCPSGGGGGFYNTLNSTISSPLGAAYTCLLVDPAPPTLVYGSIGEGSTIVPLNATSGNLTSIRFNWKSTTSATPMTGCPSSTNNVFSTSAGWGCGYGILRFDLVPVNAPFNINGLSNTTMTSFAVPISTGALTSVNYAAGSGNDVLGVRCNNTGCNLTVNLPGSSPSYYLRVSSLYKAVSLEISGTNAAGSINLTGAQALVDSTGKAQDVLRRIQVRIPLSDTSKNKLPDFALQSTESICKRFSVMQGRFDNDSGLAGITSSSPMCDPSL